MKNIEITKDNWFHYKNQLLNLEDKIKADMVRQGIGDLFFTTGEDIKDYVYNPIHHVYAIVDENDNVLAQTYLIGPGSHIQGDYSDLPKYFTMGEEFLEYVKKHKYKDEDEFMYTCNSVYFAKLCAFEYALKNIYGSVNFDKFLEDLNKEKLSETHFDERTRLRRDINKYMSEFMSKHKMQEFYRQFYNVNSKFANYTIKPEVTHAYDSFIEASKITVYDKKIENEKTYFEANVHNTIEVDTYITDPEARKKGLAKFLSTVALNKTITEFFDNNDSDILYLSVTLHKDNYLSENIANFLGFKDYIDLERRATIERKAYMKKIDRNTYREYLTYLNKKLTYFYGYGCECVSDEEKEFFELEKEIHEREILEEIDRRIENNEFDEDKRTFVENIRNNILKTDKSHKQKCFK